MPGSHGLSREAEAQKERLHLTAGERGAACSLEPSALASENPSPPSSLEQVLQSLGELRLDQVICITAHAMTFGPRAWCRLANLHSSLIGKSRGSELAGQDTLGGGGHPPSQGTSKL